MPKFSILNPNFTLSLPKYQMVAGFFDIMSHIVEQYFSGDDDNTSDYISEGLLRSLIHSSRIAVKDPKNYEARSNIMWTATWALNTLIAKGKSTDWEVHMIGQAVGAYTDATHGMTLSAVSMPYYRFIMPYAVDKFKRYAINVWDVDPNGKTDTEVAQEGLDRWSYMNELGLVMNIKIVRYRRYDLRYCGQYVYNGRWIQSLVQRRYSRNFETFNVKENTMGKKVLVYRSSFRKGGNSELLAKEFIKGAEESGNDVEFISLAGKNISFCRGCQACHSKR